MCNKRRFNPAKGEGHGHRKLDWAAVRLIRMRYAAGGISMRELAVEHGVHVSQISRVVNGKTWVEGSDASAAGGRVATDDQAAQRRSGAKRRCAGTGLEAA